MEEDHLDIDMADSYYFNDTGSNLNLNRHRSQVTKQSRDQRLLNSQLMPPSLFECSIN